MKHLRLTRFGALSLVAPALVLGAATTGAQTVQNQFAILGASDPGQNDEFSAGIALDGDRMVVGAARADIGPTTTSANQGITYVYDFDGTNWVEQAILRASVAALGDEFGSDVALQGDRFASGSRLADVGGNTDQGRAFVFEFDGTTWSETDALLASDGGASDLFGSLLRLEGDFLFVASPGNDAPGSTLGDEGAVYVFEYDGSAWTEVQKLVASDAEETEGFGSALAVDDERLIVGASDEIDAGAASGAVYVFEYDGTNWVETAKVVPSVRHAGQSFGSSADVDGDRLVVGASGNDTTGGTLAAGALWVFEFDGTTWNEVTKLEASDAEQDDFLGTSCWLQGDFAVSGAIGEDTVASNAGAAYLFEFDGTTWGEIAKLQSTNGGIGDDLGREVVVQGDLVLTSSRLASPLVGSRVGGVYQFDTSTNAGAMHADFLATPRAGQNPLAIQFTDASVGGATSWDWDFGDGFTSTEENPEHTYYNFGTFDVTLTVTGALGTDTTTKVGLIEADALLASSTVRNGSGANRSCYGIVTDPVIGGTLSTTVDGTGYAGIAGLTIVLGYDVPLAGVFTSFGELLVAPEPFGGFFAYGTVIDSLGGVATHSSAVPTDVTFVGIQLFSQGVVLGDAGPELCNAIDYLIGW